MGSLQQLYECNIIGTACRPRPRDHGLAPGSGNYHAQLQLRSRPLPIGPSPGSSAPPVSGSRGFQPGLHFPTCIPGSALLGLTPGAGLRAAAVGPLTPLPPAPARNESLHSAAVRAGHSGGWRRAAQVSTCGSRRRGNGWPVGKDEGGKAEWRLPTLGPPRSPPAHPSSSAPRE